MKLRIFSDLHYSYNYLQIENFEMFRENYFNNFMKFFFKKEADYYISLGDITNTGRKEEFEGVYEIIEKYHEEGKFRMVLGNHDLYTQDRKDVQKYIKNPLNFSIEHKEACLLFIDTPINDSEVPALKEIGFHYGGRIEDDQMQWIRGFFGNNQGKNIIVFGHHPLKNTTFLSERQYAYIEQTEELYQIMKAHPQNVIYINGHKHADSIVRDGNCTFIQIVDVINHPTVRDIVITDEFFTMNSIDFNLKDAQIGRYLGTKMKEYNLNYYGYQGEENREITIKFKESHYE